MPADQFTLDGNGERSVKNMGGSLSRTRRLLGYLLAVAGSAVLALLLRPLRGDMELASESLLFLLLVVTTAILGGLGPALLSSALGSLLLNYFFTEPFGAFRIQTSSDIAAVVVFTTVAAMVSAVVDLAARRASAAREAAELDAANRLRTALLVAVGHDLRTPLATAKAVVSGLRSRNVTLSEDDRAELLEAADESLDRLSTLVDNLLDLSRLQAGVMPVRTGSVPLREVIARALDDLDVEPGDVIVDLAGDLPDVLADPGLLERALVNVVANALRHSPQPPRLSATANDGSVELKVVDTGPGIAAEDHERVFQPFQRLGDTTVGGLGLGLALSRGLVEAMAGGVTLGGTPGGGLTVVISLPSRPLSRATRPSRPTSHRPASPRPGGAS